MSSRTLAVLLAAGATATTAVPPTAAIAARRARALDWTYEVTVRAQEHVRWSESSSHDIGIPGHPCVVARAASGMTELTLTSVRPTRVMVLRGAGGRLPQLDVGTGEGVAVRGPSTTQGGDVTTHTGDGTCASANPPQARPVTGCGTRTVRASWSLAWRGRHAVAPATTVADDREDCPSGPSTALTWAGGTAPSLTAAIASVSPTRFEGTRQFTVHGRRTFTGTASADGRGGETVTWQWEATYRRVR